MIVGVIISDETSIRAAQSLAAHPGVDEVVVFSPATSKAFRVVQNASGVDYAFGTGPVAPERARRLEVPLIWDGEAAEDGVVVHGASARGLALAVAARESDPQLVAVAHPDLEGGNHQKIRFPDPVGRRPARDDLYSGRRVATAHSDNQFAAVLTNGVARRVAIVDDASFMDGIALAAAIGAIDDEPVAVWDSALAYLRTATEMGLTMAEGERAG